MKIFGWTFGKEKKSYDGFGGSYGLYTGYGNTKVSEQELFSGWVFASVRAIADQVAQIELRLHKKQRGEDIAIEEHPAIELLDSVNPFFTRYTLFERLQSNLELYGNEYWLIEKDSKGMPIEIIPLNPTCVRVVRPNKPTKDTYVDYYEYDVMGKIEKIDPSNIVHFKNYNPFSDVVGMSTLENARLLIETNIYTKEYNRRFFQNDATPNTVLTHPDSLQNEEIQRILDKWNDKYSGFRKAHKTALLHGGMDIKVLGNHSDMQFIEQSRMTRDDILAIFGVPKTILGIIEDVTVSNAKASNYIFSLRTVKPKMHRITDTLNEFYLPLFKDESLYFDYKSPVQEDQVEITTANATKFNNGQLTINEWRKQDGLPPVEGGDLVFMPFSLTAYGRPIEEKKVEQPRGKSLSLTLKEKVREVVKKTQKVATKENELIPSQSMVPEFIANDLQSQPSMDLESFEALGKKVNEQQRRREEPYIRKMKSIMDGIFQDQSKEAEKNLLKFMKTKGKKIIKKEKLPDFIDKSKWVTVTINFITPLMGDLFEKEGKQAYHNLGLNPEDFSLSTPTAQDFLRKNAKKFAGEVTETTSQLIRDEIAFGLDEGEGIADLTARVATMSGFSDRRSETIALTETHRTAGQAEVQAWEESGVVVRKIWYTALDERVCPECEALHGEEIDLGDDFLTASDLRDLGESVYDGGVDIAQRHVNCRCTLIPVLKEE